MAPEARPLVHVFGHEHDNGGRVHWDEELGMWFANCSVMDKAVSRSTGHRLRGPDLGVVVIDFDEQRAVKSVAVVSTGQ